MESVADLWYTAFLKHQDQAHKARRYSQPTEGFSRAMMICHMEYRCATAIEMVEARKP